MGSSSEKPSLRIVFLGTSEFAEESLRALVEADRAPTLVVTRPDAQKGRGRSLSPSPVGQYAEECGLPCLKPTDVNEASSLALLRAEQADLFVVVAYGQKLGSELLSFPRLGSVNVHGSLLPKYRGAAPVHRAILEGESETGVTLLEVVEKMDAGPMLGKRSTPIREGETAGELHDRLAILGAELLVDLLPAIEDGTVPREEQDASQVTWAHRLKKEDGRLDLAMSQGAIVNFVRGMSPWPGAFCDLVDSEASDRSRVVLREVRPAEGSPSGLPGGLSVEAGRLFVDVVEGRVEVVSLQRVGKKPMAADAFLRGFELRPTHRFE